MAKYIKTSTKTGSIETKTTEFQELVDMIQTSLHETEKSAESSKEGEVLVEFIRALAKESTKSYRSEFAELMGLKESGLNSVLYQRNITGKNLANILLQLSNTSAEEFISEFFLYLVEKKSKEDPPEWMKVFMKMKNLTDEEKTYLAMVGLKFDDMIESRKK